MHASNDFLAVLRGLSESEPGDVLVVNTLNSARVVAGELFCAEAARKGVCGIAVDGAMRDVAYLSDFSTVRRYAKSVTPYSGGIQSVGEMQVTVDCGGVVVSPGDIIVGENDGIAAACAETFSKILDTAREIQNAEHAIKEGISQNVSLLSMTNYEEHVRTRTSRKAPSLTFRIK